MGAWWHERDWLRAGKTAGVLASTILLLAGCGSSSDSDPAELATRIGASKCERTNYTIKSNLTGDKTAIYSCYRNYQNICVTEENDIARDETATVTALFADAFVADKPECAD